MPHHPLGRVAPALFVSLCLALVPAAASAGKGKKKSEDGAAAGGDKTLDKQMAWEQKVMGEDGDKQADAAKIARANKLAEESRKHPPPEPAPKVKDPSKQGVRAKQEASIGLPIESDEKAPAKKVATGKKGGEGKTEKQASNSANDELGQLVAASLAEDKGGDGAPSDANPLTATGGSPSKASRGSAKAHPASRAKPTKHKAKGRSHRKTAASAEQPNALDRLFAGG